jgi:hypothetical protein
MLRLVGDDVPSIDEFMNRYRVSLTRVPPSIVSNFTRRWTILRRCTD